MHNLIHETYTSSPVPIPPSFLTSPPPDRTAAPTAHRIDFAASSLPEYRAAHALLIENALSASECETLLALAEASAGAPFPRRPDDRTVPGGRAECWRPALVHAGPGAGMLATDYRNSDRIIWDSEEMTSRLWARCLEAEGVGEALYGVGLPGGGAGDPRSVLGPSAAAAGQRWRFVKLNERMRFLKYEAGGFFRAHCDGSYINPDNPRQRTLYTLHLYLNSAGNQEEGNIGSNTHDSDGPELLKGGATTFYDPHVWGDEDLENVRQMNVNAKMGRILIFQHRDLLHAGEEVKAGVKFTLRTDLLFERLD